MNDITRAIISRLLLLFAGVFLLARAVEIDTDLSQNENDVVDLNSDAKFFLNFGAQKSAKSKVDLLSSVFKKRIDHIKSKHKKVDVVFLIDASSSIGKANFESELKFVRKLLSDFTVSLNYTRVAVVTFSSMGKIVRHVDQITRATAMNDKCRLLNHQLTEIRYTGGGTHTYGALVEAKEIFWRARWGSKRLIFLITDGFSNGRSPIPIAEELKRDNVTIFTIGIQSGNYVELYNISSSPGELHSYLLDSFGQFESLARKALHTDYKAGDNVVVENRTMCNILCSDGNGAANGFECCDVNSDCSCGINSGHFSCRCRKGFYGSGAGSPCLPCPNGTFWDTWNTCKTCPDKNHITLTIPALSIDDCVCKTGFKAHQNGHCEAITCPELIPPENGYFTSSCGQVLNYACGARCKSGFQLTGSSIRICQANGSWSGAETECHTRHCPSLQIPYYGLAICKNPDLNLYFDYSPRNATFMEKYEIAAERVTSKMPIDTECNFKCGPGFFLVGSHSRNCLPLAKWDGLQTGCKQILCPQLPKVKFGEYDPTDCAEQKSAHGSNCTLICEFGFELKGGPATKFCGGKRNGIWTQKNKTPRCVDVTPPTLICPGDYTIALHDDFNYTLVTTLHQPYVMDNSGEVNFWIKPAIKEQGIKLGTGQHTFTYVAVDSFKNKERCNFTVTVIDRTPPVFENCVNPPKIYVGLEDNNENGQFIEWEEPAAYDNSQEAVNVTKNINFGYLKVGEYEVKYLATDGANNTSECVIKVVIGERSCKKLDPPLNGQAICVKNSTHMWCEVSCNLGYAIYDEGENINLESLRLTCENQLGWWKYESIPDCTLLEQPEYVEEVISFSLDSDSLFCDDEKGQEEVHLELIENLRKHLCKDQNEGCEIASDIPQCTEDNSALNETIADKSFYQISKRSTNQKTKAKTNIKMNFYARVSKKLNIWDANSSRSDNIERFKQEIHDLPGNEELRQKLINLKLDVSALRIDELVRCADGSVSRKFTCVQCPRGTFHDLDQNACHGCPVGSYADSPGQIACNSCPSNYSNRKTHSKSLDECKQLCPPGTYAREKNSRRTKLKTRTLMPFCRKCNPGEFNKHYDQLVCERCPEGHTSPRGSPDLNYCKKRLDPPCVAQPPTCGEHGLCTPLPENQHLYNCACDEHFLGAHCDIPLNFCLSAPCYNGGTCRNHANGTFTCKCVENYSGPLCESFRDPCQWQGQCQNGGSCVEIGGRAICECQPGFDGEFCEQSSAVCTADLCETGNCTNIGGAYNCLCPPGRIGKRCHLKPCDYLPCPQNARCVDLENTSPTTKENFYCDCLKGFKGDECREIENPCDRNPCRNNGKCSPVALRSLSNPRHVPVSPFHEDIFKKFSCECPPYFYGERCETLITPDFVMEFEKTNVNDFIRLDGPRENLQEVSLCAWIQTNDTFNYGTIVSYAAGEVDNMLTLTDYNGFVFYINGSHVITDIEANDGLWHFLCFTWTSENDGYYEVYLDGEIVATGSNLNKGNEIEGRGVLIVGQEQDALGSSFSESESFVGKLSNLDIWSRTLPGFEILELYGSCEPYQGDLYSWTDFKLKAHGEIKIYPSNFCLPCTRDLQLNNGRIIYVANNALYQCNEGFKLDGKPLRQCLRTSEWQRSAPVCRLIRCGHLNGIANGNIRLTKTSYGGVATFECDESFDLVYEGDYVPSFRRECLQSGMWSEKNPECVSRVVCQPLKVPLNAKIIYATDKGALNESQPFYRVGTMAEVQCVDEYLHLTGENLITCLATGVWDISVPNCLTNAAATTTKKSKPDINFWRNLRAFLFYGCKPVDPNPLPEFCQQNVTTSLSDLTNYEITDSKEIINTDLKLVDLLERTLASARFGEMRLENFFQFVLYQNETEEEDYFNSYYENSLRFTLCLYIDVLIIEPEIAADYTVQERLNENIIELLKKVITPVYENYLVTRDSKNASSKNAILSMIASKEEESIAQRANIDT